jgi:uncharacterized protein YqhQ
MASSKSKIPHYGGQALIEGVLMRGKSFAVAAMRSSDHQIIIEEEEIEGRESKNFRNWPFLRGVFVLWDSLVLGMKYLTISANLQTGEDEKIEGFTLVFTLVLSLSIAVGLFFVLPTFITAGIERLIIFSNFGRNLIEGFFRLSIFLLYLWAIGKSPEIARVFAYHGAEHKTINAYEDGKKMNAEIVIRYPLEHVRCGTSFLLTLIVISIFIFTLLGNLSLIERIFSRILLIPIIAMFAYEIIRFLSDRVDHPFVKMISYPNLLLQRLTTRDPSIEMVDVAISAFNRLIELENG